MIAGMHYKWEHFSLFIGKFRSLITTSDLIQPSLEINLVMSIKVLNWDDSALPFLGIYSTDVYENIYWSIFVIARS